MMSIFIIAALKTSQNYQADSARLAYADGGKKLLIHLFHGENHVIDEKNEQNYVQIHFIKQTLAIDNVDASLQRNERAYRR